MHFDKSKYLPTSTALERVEYSTKEHMLRVHYRTGSHQDFTDIDAHHYDGLINASSAGSYLHTYIKPNIKQVQRTNVFRK